MSKKTIAIITELIPLISAPLSIALIASGADSDALRTVIGITVILGLLGFVFFFIGRALAGDDKAVRILGILDWFATLAIIGIYGVAFMVFGL